MRRSRQFSLVRGIALAAAGIVAALGGPAMAQDEHIAGVWQIETPIFNLTTVDGDTPPLLPEAAETYRRHLAMRAEGDTSFDSATWCASVGMPRMMTINYPFEIVVVHPYVAVLGEWNWWARVIYLDGALSDTALSGDQPQSEVTLFLGGADPEGPMGFSTGTWEGKTLVVETTKLRATTLLDNSGLPHSDALKLTERIQLLAPDVLENRITIDDPKTYRRPWETVVTYRRRADDIKEDVCLDRIKAGEPAVRP